MAIFNPTRMKPHVRKAIIWGGPLFIFGLVRAVLMMSNSYYSYSIGELLVGSLIPGLAFFTVGLLFSLVHTLIKWAFSD